MDGSGSEEFIDRTAYRINIKRGNGDVFNGIAYLVEGSTILFENGFKVKHVFKKKPEKFGSTEISKDLPFKIRDKIVALKAYEYK